MRTFPSVLSDDILDKMFINASKYEVREDEYDPHPVVVHDGKGNIIGFSKEYSFTRTIKPKQTRRKSAPKTGKKKRATRRKK